MEQTARAWEGVLRNIEDRMLSGALGPGDHLPSERALATELGVGRSSVREALRVLDVLGLVRSQTGSGPQAGAIIISTPSGGMSALMRLQVAAKGFAVADVVKTRLMVETAVVAELAESAPDLGPAAKILDAMDSPNLNPAEFLALDARFHVALAEASGNPVVTAIMEGLRDSIETYVLDGVPAIPDWPAETDQLRLEHRGILSAIVAGDGATAVTRVHSHISGYYSRTQLTDQDQK